MNARETPVDTDRRTFSQADFVSWLDEDSTRALISMGHDQFYAYFIEFGISGSGRTRDEAVENAADLMMEYLVFSFCEGRSYREAKKAPPLRLRLRLMRKRVLRGIKSPLTHLGGLISVPINTRDVRNLAH